MIHLLSAINKQLAAEDFVCDLVRRVSFIWSIHPSLAKLHHLIVFCFPDITIDAFFFLINWKFYNYPLTVLTGSFLFYLNNNFKQDYSVFDAFLERQVEVTPTTRSRSSMSVGSHSVGPDNDWSGQSLLVFLFFF